MFCKYLWDLRGQAVHLSHLSQEFLKTILKDSSIQSGENQPQGPNVCDQVPSHRSHTQPRPGQSKPSFTQAMWCFRKHMTQSGSIRIFLRIFPPGGLLGMEDVSSGRLMSIPVSIWGLLEKMKPRGGERGESPHGLRQCQSTY